MLDVSFKEINMIKLKLLLILGLIFTTLRVATACSISTSGANLGPVSSFNIPTLAPQQISGGLACNVLLDLLSTRYIKYIPVSAPTKLKHSNGVNEVAIEIRDVQDNLVVTGVEKDLSDFAVLSLLFGGPNKSVPFTIKIQPTIGLKPGVYSGNLNIKWYYYVNGVGLLGIGLISYYSPGLTKALLGGITNWGTGADALIPITLTIDQDCKIMTNNVSFGSAVFTSQFNSVTGTVQIACSSDTPYNVGLSNGQNFNVTRRLKHASQASYIGYEVYKNNTTARWGLQGQERWNSNEATVNPMIYNAITQQSYSFTGKILNPSNTVFPDGIYSDILQVDVQF